MKSQGFPLLVQSPGQMIKAVERFKVVEDFQDKLAAGASDGSAAAELGIPLVTLRRWTRRYRCDGLAGLLGRQHRSGRKKKSQALPIDRHQ
ncbi:MAG: helix-turn-helix domain-containing protein [Verrucomicrobia bacterium]|nr:helix-turn-helix domain-containing protein [Verrucomicrobiota bacterium]